MKKGKTIFLIIYLVFHLGLLIASIVVNLRSEDFQFLFSVRDNMAVTVWYAAIGVILFIINVVMITASSRNHSKNEERLRREINTLKAKIYDLQDATPAATESSKEEKGIKNSSDKDRKE